MQNHVFSDLCVCVGGGGVVMGGEISKSCGMFFVQVERVVCDIV